MLEDSLPVFEHFFGRLVSFRGPSAKRLGKETRESVAHARIEQFRGERRFLAGEFSRAAPIAPSRQSAGGHFIERHCGGEPLRVDVPRFLFAQFQERIEVGPGASADILGRHPRERKIEQR